MNPITRPNPPDATDPEGPDPEGPDPDGLDPDGLDPDGLDPEGFDPHATDVVLPPMAGGEAKRLLMILPAAGSTPGLHVTAAIAWQQKFRSAQAVLLAAPHPAPVQPGDGETGPRHRYWIDPAEYPVSAGSIRREAGAVAGRIRAWQARSGIDAEQTILIGFSQGASIALELAFAPCRIAGIIVGFAPRLYRLPVDGDRIASTIHLIHGRYDSVVPLAHGEAALRRLGSIAATVSLNIVEDGGHVVDQDQLNIATQRTMQTLFSGRRERGNKPLH